MGCRLRMTSLDLAPPCRVKRLPLLLKPDQRDGVGGLPVGATTLTLCVITAGFNIASFTLRVRVITGMRNTHASAKYATMDARSRHYPHVTL